MASTGDSFVSRSRWYDPCPSAREGYPGPSDLAEFLRDLPFEKAVLIPCDDDWVRAVASLNHDLRGRFLASVAHPNVIDALMDKAHLAAELERLGLPHPPTIPISSSRELEALPERLLMNALLKPRDSLGFQRHFGNKAFLVHDKREALARFAEIEKDGHGLVVQEFIAAAVSDHYLIGGFIDREGQIRTRFARQRIRIFPPDTGIGSLEISTSLDPLTSAWETLERLFANIRYRGIFSAEFVRDPRDGVFRLLEVNTRAYIHVEFAAQCGVDLVFMAYQDALGMPVESVIDYAVGKTSVDLYGDLQAAWRLVKDGQLSLSAWLFSYVGAEGLIYAWDDPAPGLRRLRDFLEAQVQVARQGRDSPRSGRGRAGS